MSDPFKRLVDAETIAWSQYKANYATSDRLFRLAQQLPKVEADFAWEQQRIAHEHAVTALRSANILMHAIDCAMGTVAPHETVRRVRRRL